MFLVGSLEDAPLRGGRRPQLGVAVRLPLSHSLSCSFTLSLVRCLFLSLSLPFTLYLVRTLSRSLSLSLSFALSLVRFLSLLPSLPPPLPFTPSLNKSFTVEQRSFSRQKNIFYLVGIHTLNTDTIHFRTQVRLTLALRVVHSGLVT